MEGYVRAQPYVDFKTHDIYPTFTSKRKDHLPVRTRAGNGN